MKLFKRIINIVLAMSIILSNIILVVSAEEKEGIVKSAKSYILMEENTGQILLENNKDEKMELASVTKIMTLLLIMEDIESGKYSFETKITASSNAEKMGGSQIYLKEGEQMSANELIKAICISSANDACVAMAEFSAGSVEEFVNRMNEKAKVLGMNNTNFTNCTGLPTENHYSSAYDIALMSRELLKHKKVFDYTKIWMDTLRDGKFGLANTNKLVKHYKGATGLKTGYTDKAKFCLSATATRDDLSLIAVVLGCETSKDRFRDASSLLDYGFSNYSFYINNDISKKYDIMVLKGKEKLCYGIPEITEGILVKKGQDKNITYQVNLKESIVAPVYKDEIVGEIKFFLNKEEILKVPVKSDRDIEKLNLTDYMILYLKKIFYKN